MNRQALLEMLAEAEAAIDRVVIVHVTADGLEQAEPRPPITPPAPKIGKPRKNSAQSRRARGELPPRRRR
jgi:hypothetical protein